jgi:hypothetical protein
MKMKKIFILCAFSLVATTIFAQQQVATVSNAVPNQTVKAAPVADALMLKETVYNFGKIPQGKPVTHIFEVVNTSTTPFKLDNVQASCGCTTPQWNRDEVIAPGTTANITVGYNAASEGLFTKNITIMYNGTQTKVLIIKGEVWKTPAASAPANDGLSDLKK